MVGLEQDCISILLESKPMACPRPRVAKGCAYMPSTYVRWKREQKSKIRRQTKQKGITSPVLIVMSFVFKRPQSMMRKADPQGRIFKATKPDIDNLCKSVMDVLQDCRLITDDSQVVGIKADKWYGAMEENKKSERNHIKIDIYPL